MPFTRLLHLAVWLQAASYCRATEEACKSSVTEEVGRAMMQLLGGPAKKTVSKHAPEQKSKPATKTTYKLSKLLRSAFGKGKTNKRSKSSAFGKRKTKKRSKSSAKAKTTPDAANVALSNNGYKAIASLCCPYEMEEYIRRIVKSEDLKICNEGGLQGTVPYHICESVQNYSLLLKEVRDSYSGSCPWTAPKNEGCKKMSKSCGSTANPLAHRRRNCGRNDNSHFLGLDMQNAATNQVEDSKCGTHQQFADVSAESGILKNCSIKGDITENQTAKRACLNECCATTSCIGIVIQDGATTLQKSFGEAKTTEGAMAYLHRQR